MRLRDILSLAAHNLRESPLRTALCALSVAVGLTPEMLPMVINACLAKGSAAMGKSKRWSKTSMPCRDLEAWMFFALTKPGP